MYRRRAIHTVYHCDRSRVKGLLAYFLKLPGNFGRHNLANGCPYAQREARYPTRTYIKDFPSGFFREKISKSRDRTFCLGISTFFAASRREATPRSARENFGVLARIRAVFNEIERGFLWRNRWLELPTMHTYTHTHSHTRRAPLCRCCHCRCWRQCPTVGAAIVRERPAL